MADESPAVSSACVATLTQGELRVLEQLRRGLKSPAIAQVSGRSVHTVRTISRNLREKFGAHSVSELLAGLESGVYAIAQTRKAQPAFDLTSALDALDRANAEKRWSRPMRTLRLHANEIAALLRMGQAHQAMVASGRRIAENLDSVVGGVEELLAKGRDARASLAAAIGHEMGESDAKRRTLRGPAELARFGAILLRHPFPLHGGDRAEVLDAFRRSYAAGLRDYQAALTLRERMAGRAPRAPRVSRRT